MTIVARDCRAIIALSTALVLLLAAVLGWVGEPDRWPEPEEIPQQGEAADISSRTHAPAALARLVREPQNAWSNVAFLVAGAFLFSTCASRLARANGVVLAMVGFGSFLYHASASRSWRHVDVGAMYALFLLSVALCAAAMLPRWRPALERRAVALAIMSGLAAVALTAGRNLVIGGIKPLSLRFATMLSAGAIILSLADVARRRETIAAALQFLGIVTLFGIAVLCQTWDRPGGRFYRPDAWLQAHAVWHGLAAITFAWAVRFLDQVVGPGGMPAERS